MIARAASFANLGRLVLAMMWSAEVPFRLTNFTTLWLRIALKLLRVRHARSDSSVDICDTSFMNFATCLRKSGGNGVVSSVLFVLNFANTGWNSSMGRAMRNGEPWA